MKIELSQITDHLLAHGIKPSSQRIAIMKYLMENRVHPTVDMIYNGLKSDMPTLSRTTVYNTVWLLAENNAILALDIDNKNVHFDYIEYEHAHFYCRDCGAIIDVELGALKYPANNGIHIENMNVYYKGLCDKCYKNKETKNNIV